jgi:hypothetical protein
MEDIMSDFNYEFDIKKSIDSTYLYGVASTTKLDRDSEAVDMSSLESCFKSYMATNPIICFNHDVHKAIGTVVDKYEGKDGTVYKSGVINGLLKIVVKLSSVANDVIEQINEGILKSFSIGGRAKHVLKGEITNLVFTDLFEISVVPIGSNKESLFSVVKSVCTGENCPNNIKGDEIMDKNEIREIMKSIMAETETEDVVKSLTTQVEELTAELTAIKTVKVQKGIVEGEAPVIGEISLIDSIVANHYGGN